MANKKVLIVDNDRDFLTELGETLSLSGYDLIAVQDPMVTMETVEKTHIDVILLDLQMPGKSGFELAHELNSFSHFRDVPIIAMTGFLREDYESLLKTCGIRKCLRKPLRPLNVIAEIENAMA